MRMQPTAPAALAALAIALLAVFSANAGAETAYRAEAERFVAYNDLGGGEIRVSDCFGASQYKIVDGVDLAGEWIQVRLSVARSGCYYPVVAYQAGAEWKIDLRMSVLDAGGPGANHVTEFSVIGTGTG